MKQKQKPNRTKVSLRDDITFKHFFKNNEKALISLLKNFLPLPKERHIQEVKILDSFLPLVDPKDKSAIMDLRLTMDNKERVNVEMQMCTHKAFTERVLFYWAKNYISQLKEGQRYEKLFPVYSLIFCDFNLFSATQDFYSSLAILSEKPPHFALSSHLRMVFVELKKFKKGDIKSLVDIREAWCYLLRWFEDMSSVEKRLFAKRNHQMEELMDWTRPLSLKEQEQVLAEAREKNWRDRMAREDYVFEQGLEEGIEKGAQAEKQAVVLNMLKGGFDTPVIAKITGFSEEEINKLKNSS